METKPILFSADMVRALLDGRKVQHRIQFSKRDIRNIGYAAAIGECSDFVESGSLEKYDESYALELCPYGQPGGLLWVRETWRQFDSSDECDHLDFPCGCPASGTIIYRATADDGESKWKPSTQMHRWASRLTLRITGVRIERLQDATRNDAELEGHASPPAPGMNWAIGPRANLRFDWRGCWDSNPWVWVLEFEVIKANVDDALKQEGVA